VLLQSARTINIGFLMMIAMVELLKEWTFVLPVKDLE